MSQHKTQVILMVSQKGGSAKTTNVLNLATASMFQGSRNVVILDCDPQRTASLWQDDNREDRIKDYVYVLPKVAAPANDMMPSELIKRLKNAQVDEIWIDTAGFVGYKQDTAQMYLNDILPHVDMIVTPLKASKFDLNATRDTMEYINFMGKNIDLNVPKLLLPSDIKGGDKGVAYINNLLEQVVSKPEFSDWTVMKSYIPYSGVFVKTHERGGNAFVPRKVDKVTEAYIEALLEIYEKLGQSSGSEKLETIDDILAGLHTTRLNASKEKRQDELEDE